MEDYTINATRDWLDAQSVAVKDEQPVPLIGVENISFNHFIMMVIPVADMICREMKKVRGKADWHSDNAIDYIGHLLLIRSWMSLSDKKKVWLSSLPDLISIDFIDTLLRDPNLPTKALISLLVFVEDRMSFNRSLLIRGLPQSDLTEDLFRLASAAATEIFKKMPPTLIASALWVDLQAEYINGQTQFRVNLRLGVE